MAVAVSWLPLTTHAQPSAFTYQGHLSASGAPATGVYDMRFVLRDALAGGNQVPGTPVPAGLVAVTNGQFTATLDFGGTAFNGAARWLEIGVRTNGSLAAHTTLAPRQPLTATPYATMASSAATYTGAVSDSQLSTNVARLSIPQTFSGLTTFGPASGAPFAVTSTNRVTNLHADLLDGFSANAFWNITGNLGTGVSNFVGTVDNQPLQFRVNNARALRLEPNATSPNVIGGHPGNNVTVGAAGATIGGGGANGATNEVTALHGTVSGGRANRVLANFGAIGGGDSNVAANIQATVSGGLNNQASGPLAVIAGGGTNVASGSGAAVGGGSQNTSSGLRTVVSGGAGNIAAINYSVVAGGLLNLASGTGAAVLGGISNEATNSYATVLGGFDNVAGAVSSYAAGNAARALHEGTFVWSDTSSAVPFASTAPYQFLIRAAGGVGIGGAPQDAALDVQGDVHVNDFDIFLRGGSDRSAGLGWYGFGKTFAGVNIDGPVSYGWSGGALGTIQGGTRIALQWNLAGNVGLGTASPGARLHVADSVPTVGLFQSSHPDGTWLTIRNTGGGDTWSILSTGSGNGQGAGHLLFYDSDTGAQTILRDNGNMGIGTSTPRDLLEVRGADAVVRIVNGNDYGGNLGGFVGDSWGTLQFGMFNDTASLIGEVSAGTRRSFFGCDNQGRVGSLVNAFGNPIFRNLLDDTNGNMSVNNAGAINFGNNTRQMINLYNAGYGIGVQNSTMYCRSDFNFAWYRNGSHANGIYDSGGGTTLMRLDSGGLTVNGTFISSSDRARKENFAEVKPRDVLERLTSMPIQRWNYKDDAKVRHIGPMAQDFHAAFGVGPDEKHIAMVDADGVALAAIQGLHEVVKEKEVQIESLVKENETLQDRLAALEKAVSTLAAQVRDGRR